MGRSRPIWIASSLACVVGCFGEPPPVGGPDPATSSVAGDTTGATTHQPRLDSGIDGESGDDAATTSDAPSTSGPMDDSDGPGESGDPDDSGSSDPTDASTTSVDATTGGLSSDGDDSSTGEPAVWTCYFQFYDNDDGCDCGCGIVDPDCADATVGSCDYCSQVGSCGVAGGCPSNIDPDNNAQCVD